MTANLIRLNLAAGFSNLANAADAKSRAAD